MTSGTDTRIYNYFRITECTDRNSNILIVVAMRWWLTVDDGVVANDCEVLVQQYTVLLPLAKITTAWLNMQ